MLILNEKRFFTVDKITKIRSYLSNVKKYSIFRVWK